VATPELQVTLVLVSQDIAVTQVPEPLVIAATLVGLVTPLSPATVVTVRSLVIVATPQLLAIPVQVVTLPFQVTPDQEFPAIQA
jgi:hypothetical protein